MQNDQPMSGWPRIADDAAQARRWITAMVTLYVAVAVASYQEAIRGQSNDATCIVFLVCGSFFVAILAIILQQLWDIHVRNPHKD